MILCTPYIHLFLILSCLQIFVQALGHRGHVRLPVRRPPNLTQPLKHLHIGRAFNPRGAKYGEGIDDVDVAPALHDVLSKHRHTLEYLDLDVDKSSVWKLPNLKRFNFMGDIYSVVTFEGSEIINYSETFPNLESLGFTPWDGDWMPCYKSFIFPRGRKFVKL